MEKISRYPRIRSDRYKWLIYVAIIGSIEKVQSRSSFYFDHILKAIILHLSWVKRERKNPHRIIFSTMTITETGVNAHNSRSLHVLSSFPTFYCSPTSVCRGWTLVSTYYGEWPANKNNETKKKKSFVCWNYGQYRTRSRIFTRPIV